MTDTTPPAGPAGEPLAPPPTAPTADPAPATILDHEEHVLPSGSLWQQMRTDPQYAPEHLALEAVRRLGPQARAWAAGVRAEYPAIHPDQLAQLAVRRFTNHARLSGAVSGATGLPGAVVDVGVLAWTQARMVLHIAAAYGADPEHRDRAVDLLMLQRIHKVAETARLALGVAAGRERAAALFARATQAPLGRVMLRLGVRLAQMAGVRAARRMVAKVIPGAAIVLGTWANSSATTGLARRATQLYRTPALLAHNAPPPALPDTRPAPPLAVPRPRPVPPQETLPPAVPSPDARDTPPPPREARDGSGGLA